MDFVIGDTVDVGVDIDKIRGEVTRIEYKDDEPYLVEIKRPSGSHNEYLGDPEAEPGSEFDFITKVEV